METTPRIINRPTYLSRIEAFIGKNLIKTLVGQRRVGKSYILKSVSRLIRERNHEVNIITLNLEDFALSHIRDAEALFSEISSRLKEGKQNCIFIDEIQEVENFEMVLRSLILDDHNDVYVTGSNSKMLSTEISSVLSGRNLEIKVHPLSYKEFLDFHKKQDSDEALSDYIQYGGMPYLINLPLKSSWREYLAGLTDAIVYRDVINRHSIRNTDLLQRLLLFLSDNIGQLFSAKKISDYLKSQRLRIGVNVVQTYISYIVEACILNEVRKWDLEGKRFFEIGEKYYYEDIGIRNSIIGLRPGDLGGVLENIVFNHLKTGGYNIKIGSLSGGREIDFIGEKDGEIKYFQVALSLLEEKTIEREFGNLFSIPDNYDKYVITLKESMPVSHKGIKNLSLREFLLSNI